MSSIFDFSTNPANNTAAPPNGAPEGWLPSNVNDTVRQIMADIIGANLVVDCTGTDTYLVTLNPAPTALQDKMSIRVRFVNANTSTTPTLVPNSLSVAPGTGIIKKYGGQALIMGDIPANLVADLTWIASDGHWELLNPQPVPGAGAGVTSITFNSPLSGGTITSTGSVGITANGLANSLLAQMSANTIKGNNTGSGATPIDLTTSQVSSMLSLGSAATLNAGTAANNLVQLNGSAKLPAVDGSLLTHLPGGSVSSVGLSMPGEFSVTGTPVTGAGTLTVSKAAQTKNLVYAGPSSGANAAPAFRALVAADLPGTVNASGNTTITSLVITNGIVTFITFA